MQQFILWIVSCFIVTYVSFMPFLHACPLRFYDSCVRYISLTLQLRLESRVSDQKTQLIAVGYYWLQKTNEDEKEEVSGHPIG